MPQQEIQKQRTPQTRTIPKEPRNHRVIILNDDFTTFEFVVDVMVSIFMKSHEEAWVIAEKTHIEKKATVGSYPPDIAKSKVAKATSLARAEGFPLSFEIHPE